MRLTYLGHSAFEIETGGKKILIDPFLVKSPNYIPAGVTDIFVPARIANDSFAFFLKVCIINNFIFE